MKLGIGSYTYTWAVGVAGQMPVRPMSVFELVERAVALGVRVVQVCDNLPLTTVSKGDLSLLERRLSETGVQLELGTRGIELESLRAHLGLAIRFGTPFVRLVLDRATDEPSPEEAVERLRPLADEFRSARVRLAIENHDRFRSATLAGMVESLGRDWVGICLDTVNSFGALEGPEVVVTALAPYTVNLHVKDFTVRRVASQMGFVVEGCPAGHGRLDIPWLLDRLRGRVGLNAILELWTPSAETLEKTMSREEEWARQSVAYLRTLLPQ